MDILSALRKVTASIKTWADSKLETKLDKNLGTDNAGKVLTIGDDGNIESQMLDTGIIVLSGTDDNPINIDEIKASGTYLIKGVVTTSMDTTSGSDSAKLNKTFIDGFARGELMSIYSLQDGFVNQLMMNPTRPLVRLDSGEGYSDAIDVSYVQPVEKTTEMTQPVGIRSDGQLFTEPFNQVQSDWNENDETNPAYIKNRTHYDNRTEEVLLSSSGENVDCSEFIKISDEVMTLDELEVSKIEMSLSVNSINFDNAIFDYDGSSNPSESILGVYYHNEDVHMDLVIAVYSTNANGSTPGTYLGIDENGTGTYSMKLYREVGELKTLDPKYIKDMYYTNEIEGTLLDGTFDFVDIGRMYYYEQENSLIIEEGKAYTVVFDGTSYNCTGYIPSSGLPAVLGNASIAEPSLPSGNNEPFLVIAQNGQIQIATNLTSTSHTVKIIGLREVIKKLDVKYLPDEIYTAINTVDSKVDSKVNTKMDKLNPAGTGSFSLNRKAGTTIGDKSFAEGYYTTASGDQSHAEGNTTTASGTYSHAEGLSTTASGNQSHAEGLSTTASGSGSHAEGLSTTASADFSHAEGNSTNKFSSVVTATNPTNADIITAWKSKKFSLAKGNSSHVEGRDNLALGDRSHAEGNYTTASGNASHAEGTSTIASGNVSHAEGSFTTASKYSSHAEGSSTTASADFSHAEGSGTTASGYDSHAEGFRTTASGDDSHAEGYSTNTFSAVVTAANPTNDDIITAWKSKKFSLAKGTSSHVEGIDSLALGDKSHAEGQNTTASGNYSHVEGSGTTASSECSHAEGLGTTASGLYSHTEGNNTTASGGSSHAEGSSTTASGYDSHAEGSGTKASGNYSHAEGQSTTASGNNSHAEGSGTVANSISSLVIGEYNAYDESEFGQKVNKTTKDCSGTYYFGTEFNFNGTTGEFTISGGVTTDDVEVAFDQGKIYMSSDYNASKESNNGYVDSTIYKLVSVENLATLTYNVEEITSVCRAESRATSDNAFTIGNGAHLDNRSNAATIDWSGNAWYAGDVYVGSTSGTNKDAGSKKLATEEYVNSAVPEIPSIPTALPNPYALTFTGAVTGSYDGSEAVSVEIPSGVTDDHINSLIDTKLGVIENGSY